MQLYPRKIIKNIYISTFLHCEAICRRYVLNIIVQRWKMLHTAHRGVKDAAPVKVIQLTVMQWTERQLPQFLSKCKHHLSNASVQPSHEEDLLVKYIQYLMPRECFHCLISRTISLKCMITVRRLTYTSVVQMDRPERSCYDVHQWVKTTNERSARRIFIS